MAYTFNPDDNLNIDEVPDYLKMADQYAEDTFAKDYETALEMHQLNRQEEKYTFKSNEIPLLQSEGANMSDISQSTFDTYQIDVPTDAGIADAGIAKPAWDAKGGGMGKVQGVAAGAQLVAGGIGMLDKTEEVDAPNYISNMLGSAGQGASMGAAFGPWVAGIGGVIGATAGLIKTKSQDKATNAKISQREEQERRFAQARSTTQVNPMFAEDGMKIPITNNNERSRISPIAKLNYSKVGTEAGQLSGSLGFRSSHSRDIGQNANLYSSAYGNLNMGSQGTGVTAGMGAGINWEFMDNWNLNPYMNLNANFTGGQLNSGVRGGARLSYKFDDGGKIPSYLSQIFDLGGKTSVNPEPEPVPEQEQEQETIYNPQKDIAEMIGIPSVTAERTPSNKMAKEAESMVKTKTDISRPPGGRKERLLSEWFGIDEFLSNTCVECVKQIEDNAGIEGGIPKDIYDNRTFYDNYEKYGYVKIDKPERGALLQFFNPDKEWKDSEYGYPFHMGIADSDSTYIGDGSVSEPVYKQGIFEDKEGDQKPYKVQAYKYVGKKKKQLAKHDPPTMEEGGIIPETPTPPEEPILTQPSKLYDPSRMKTFRDEIAQKFINQETGQQMKEGAASDTIVNTLWKNIGHGEGSWLWSNKEGKSHGWSDKQKAENVAWSSTVPGNMVMNLFGLDTKAIKDYGYRTSAAHSIPMRDAAQTTKDSKYKYNMYSMKPFDKSNIKVGDVLFKGRKPLKGIDTRKWDYKKFYDQSIALGKNEEGYASHTDFISELGSDEFGSYAEMTGGNVGQTFQESKKLYYDENTGKIKGYKEGDKYTNPYKGVLSLGDRFINQGIESEAIPQLQDEQMEVSELPVELPLSKIPKTKKQLKTEKKINKWLKNK